MRRPIFWIIIALEVILCVALVIVVVKVRSDRSTTTRRSPDIPAGVSTKLADQMGLGPMGAAKTKSFTLTDQRGRSMSLASFRGHVVVLQFMDPHCTDVCPIASAEVVDAYHDLAANQSKVDFITVNVNRYNNTTADVKSFTSEHGLNAVPTWHFVTGSPASLARVWHNYGVEVEASSPTVDVVHSTQVYFIDPQGRIRYLAVTTVDHNAKGTAFLPVASEEAWGHGIATVAASLLSK